MHIQKRTLYLIIGTTLLVAIAIGVGVFAILSSLATSANAKVPTPTPVVATTATKGNATAKLLRQYAPDIKNQIAQGLKLTPDQLTLQLKAGKTLSDIAVAQGVTSTQLQTIITSAIENGLKPAVDSGALTQTQVDRQAKRFAADPTLLDRLLGGGSTKGTKQATPAATSAPAQ